MWRLGPTLLPILTILPSLPDPSSCLAPVLALANILGVNISFTPSSYWFLYKGNIQMSGFNFKTPSIYLDFSKRSTLMCVFNITVLQSKRYDIAYWQNS